MICQAVRFTPKGNKEEHAFLLLFSPSLCAPRVKPPRRESPQQRDANSRLSDYEKARNSGMRTVGNPTWELATSEQTGEATLNICFCNKIVRNVSMLGLVSTF